MSRPPSGAEPGLSSSELTNPRAERVRTVRALAGRSVRQRAGQFLVEGPQPVREAVCEAPDRVREVYLTLESGQRYPEILRAAGERGVAVRFGTPAVLEAMSPDAQHVLAVAEMTSVDVAAVLDAPAELGAAVAPRPRLVAVLAQVRDPGNAGTVVRVADAAGADAVVFSKASVELYNPKVVRATAGSMFHLPVVTDAPLIETVTALRTAGLRVLAADVSGDLDLDDLADGGELSRPTAWLFGNEAWGLPESDRDLADAVVRVPIHGRAESLNLAAAATLCLYASARAQRR